MTLDLRALGDPPGLSSLGLEIAHASVTRFYWIRCCEHCLSRQTIRRAGVEHCAGCERQVIVGRHEELPPDLEA